MNNASLTTESFLNQLLDASIEGILAFDRDCRYTAWNQAMERISGLLRADVLGKCAFEVFPFLKETGEDKCFLKALAGENATSDNRPYTVPETGRQGFFKGYYSPLRNSQDEIIGGVAVVHDITERKQAEEAAGEAHQRLTFHVENSPLAVIEWDSDARVSRWSESAERLFGWKAEEVIGKHVSDWHFVFDEDVDAVAQVTYRQRVGAELLGVQRNRNYTRDGSILYCEWYNSVLHDDAGKMVSVLSLVLDVTARKRAEEERAALLASERDLRQQAEEADRLKDEFLATLSHELRTPLTSILGWATLIRSGDVDEVNVARAIEIIERNARSQARLIDDLLDVSRIITGNLQLDVHPLQLAPLVEAANEALRPAADAKGIQVETELNSGNCIVSGDPNRLRQVIWNLLMNAIKFTPRGGKVKVRLECLSEPPALAGGSPVVRLTVSDTGEGITPEFLPYVFHRFRQEESSISRKAGGLGLGLAVVRHLVELHGGNVHARSNGPGLGSTFVVELPLASYRHDAEAETRTTEKEGMPPGPLSGSSSSSGASGSSNASGASQPGSLSGIRVLIAEDDDDSRNLLKLVLERQGAEVIAASTSAEALNTFVQSPMSNVQSQEEVQSPMSKVQGQASPSPLPVTLDPSSSRLDPSSSRLPDIIISDLGMPDEDGYELMRKIRSLTSDSALSNQSSVLIPAIALTGYATSKDRERALASGYQMHLAKPVGPEELIAAILSLIR